MGRFCTRRASQWSARATGSASRTGARSLCSSRSRRPRASTCRSNPVVRRVGTDLGIATDSIEELWAAVVAHEDQKEEARKESERERMRRWIENNPSAWRSAIANLKNGVVSAPRQARMRDPVIYGYDGQAVRSSRHGTVPMGARDLGLDSPED